MQIAIDIPEGTYKAICETKNVWERKPNHIIYLAIANGIPLVRCENCKYCHKEDESEYWCYGFCSPARLVRKDDFCSYGCKTDCKLVASWLQVGCKDRRKEG